MNKIIPLNEDILYEMKKRFYKIDNMYFCTVDGNYIGWDYSTINLFQSYSEGFVFLDFAYDNQTIKDLSYDTIHLIRKILKNV